ncbi:MAG: outer membrane protein assembly factor [Burkholderiales bacterium]|nr:outer membrane protein assembly factor [Burkholderiales bacterium]
MNCVSLLWSRVVLSPAAFFLYFVALIVPLLPTGDAVAAAADKFSYRVEVEAPVDLAKLLRQNLEIDKWHDSAEMDLNQLRVLYRNAPEDIRVLAATEGFYSPVVTPSLERRGDVWVARFVVDPGQPTRVSEVELRFTGPITSLPDGARPDVERLRLSWPLKRGEVFRQQTWEAAKRDLLRDVLVYRYPAAKISDSRAAVDPAKHEAALMVKIESGPEYRFGGLEIKGLQRYPSSIAENLNPIAAGTIYSQEALAEFQARLLETGYFAAAVVNPETEGGLARGDMDAAGPAIAPIRLTLIENTSKKLGFGVGYSTNTGVRGEIAYRDFDIFDSGLRFTTNLRLEQKQQSLLTDLEWPRNPRGHVYGIALKGLRSDIEGERLKNFGIGGRRTAGNKRNERTWSVQFETETQTLEGGVEDRRKALALGYGITLRRTDKLLTPTKGYALNVQLSGASEELLTDQDFIRGYAKWIGFFPFGEQHSLILRAEGGAVWANSRRGIPSTFVFRTGGDQTVRGYSFQSLGVSEGNAIVGGRYLAVGSAEYIYWFKPDYGAALFVDAGNAADTPADLTPALGFGLGGRWRSPVGPLALDVAYGEESDELRLHFSLGFVF